MSILSKSIAAGAALGMLHGASAPVFAGPYANIENKAKWEGSDFGAAVTHVHAGYEFEPGEDVTIYVQGGPAFVSVDGEETEKEISGKVGIKGNLSEKLKLYGEVSFITEDLEFDTQDLNLGTKIGVTYSF